MIKTSTKGGGVTVTISKPAAALALTYGKNVSRGIIEMETEICVLQFAVKEGKQEIARMKKTFDKYHLV